MAFIFFSFFKDDANEANTAQEIPLKAGPVMLSLVCPCDWLMDKIPESESFPMMTASYWHISTEILSQ